MFTIYFNLILALTTEIIFNIQQSLKFIQTDQNKAMN